MRYPTASECKRHEAKLGWKTVIIDILVLTLVLMIICGA